MTRHVRDLAAASAEGRGRAPPATTDAIWSISWPGSGPTGVIILALLFRLTGDSNALEAAREAELASLVPTGRLGLMRRNQSDYAAWDDWVAKQLSSIDPEWASNTVTRPYPVAAL